MFIAKINYVKYYSSKHYYVRVILTMQCFYVSDETMLHYLAWTLVLVVIYISLATNYYSVE